MSNTNKANAQVSIKINGTAVPPAFMRALHTMVVDTNLHLPSMFTLQLWDNNAKWADDTALVNIGIPVEITVTAATQGSRSGAEATLIKGEITSIEPNYTSYGAMMLTIGGYCKSHRLHRGKKTKTWLKQTDSSVVSQIAQGIGLQAQMDSTTVTHDYVIQYNQSDWEFIADRAARLGYRFYVENEKLFFKKAAAGTGTPIELKWGDDLRRFQPRLSAAQQGLKAKVRSWDIKTKKEVMAESVLKELLPETGFGAGAISDASKFGAAETLTFTVPTGVQNYATEIAKANANLASGRSIQAEGEAVGDPRLVAGTQVKITGVGTRFGGTYTITAATHHYDSEGTYLTNFTISGRDAASLYAMVASENGAQSGRESSVVIGLVTNINDPDGMGRIKVKFPWLSDTLESEWARIASPMAGASRGMFFLPEVNDEVLIAFEQGDLTRPYMVGALWNGKDKPPLANGVSIAGGSVAQRIIKTTSGHQIILSDKAGAEFIKIVDKTGKNSIEINSVTNDMKLLTDGNFSLEAKGKVTISAQMDVSIQSKSGKMALDGMTGATVNTSAQLKLTGTGGAEMSSTANATVKGSIVQVQGSGPVTVAGNPIKLN